MTINICRQQEQVKGNICLLFAVHVAAVNNYNDKYFNFCVDSHNRSTVRSKKTIWKNIIPYCFGKYWFATVWSSTTLCRSIMKKLLCMCTQNEMKSLCFSNVFWNETINNNFWIAVTSGFNKSVKIMSFWMCFRNIKFCLQIICSGISVSTDFVDPRNVPTVPGS